MVLDQRGSSFLRSEIRPCCTHDAANIVDLKLFLPKIPIRFNARRRMKKQQTHIKRLSVVIGQRQTMASLHPIQYPVTATVAAAAAAPAPAAEAAVLGTTQHVFTTTNEHVRHLKQMFRARKEPHTEGFLRVENLSRRNVCTRRQFELRSSVDSKLAFFMTDPGADADAEAQAVICDQLVRAPRDAWNRRT